MRRVRSKQMEGGSTKNKLEDADNINQVFFNIYRTTYHTRNTLKESWVTMGNVLQEP